MFRRAISTGLALLGVPIGAVACSDETVAPGDDGGAPTNSYESPFGILMSLYADRNHATGTLDEIARTVQPEDDPPYSKTTDIGIRWERVPISRCGVQPIGESIDFRGYDNILRAIPPTLHIVVSFELGDEECYVRADGSFPKGEQRLTDWIEAIVERFDGDGVDDMPGLVNPVKHWQVGNEMDLIPDPEAGPGPPETLDCATMTDAGLATALAHLQRIGYDAIKRSDSSATVLSGGVARLDCVETFWSAFLDSPELSGTGLDVFDYHAYAPWDGGENAAEFTAVMQSFRAALDANGFSSALLWCTESGVPAPSPNEELGQARDLVQRYVYAMSFGVEKLFWAWALLEGIGDRQCKSIFEFTGLIYDGYCGLEIHPTDPPDPGYGIPKLGYFAHRKLAEVFEGFDVRTVERITSDDGIYAFRAMKGEVPTWFAWTADAVPRSTSVDLGTPATGLVAIELVPRQSAGEDVRDYATAFDTRTVTVDSSAPTRVTIDLGDRPVVLQLPQQ